MQLTLQHTLRAAAEASFSCDDPHTAAFIATHAATHTTTHTATHTTTRTTTYTADSC